MENVYFYLNFFGSNDFSSIDVTFEALLDAIKMNDEKMVELVLKNGFNVNVTDKYGKSALHYAAFINAESSCADILIKYGMKVNLADNDGKKANIFAQSLNVHF